MREPIIERFSLSPGMPTNTDAYLKHVEETDREHRNALAARGYWQAYQVVQKSLEKILGGENPGTVVDEDHSKWYENYLGQGNSGDYCRD
jgi:hypothetical protein